MVRFVPQPTLRLCKLHSIFPIPSPKPTPSTKPTGCEKLPLLCFAKNISAWDVPAKSRMHVIDFQQLIASRGICVHYDVEDFEEDIQHLQARGWL
jgi:Uncharacterised protein family (UPF0175)